MPLSKSLRERLVIALTDPASAQELERAITEQIADIPLNISQDSLEDGQALVYSAEDQAMIAALVPLIESNITFDDGETLLFNADTGRFEAGTATTSMVMPDGATIEVLTLAQVIAGIDTEGRTVSAEVLNQAVTQIIQDTLTPTTHEQADNSPTQEVLVLVPGVVELARNRNMSLFNIVSQTSSSNLIEGVTLTNPSQTTPTNLFASLFDNSVGDNILDPAFNPVQLTVTATGQVFNLTFTNWQMGGAATGTFAGWAISSPDLLSRDDQQDAGIAALNQSLQDQALDSHSDITDTLDIFTPEDQSAFVLVNGEYHPVELSGSLERIKENPSISDLSQWTGGLTNLQTSPNTTAQIVADRDLEDNLMFELSDTNTISTLIDDSLTSGLNVERNTNYEAVIFVKKDTGIVRLGHSTDNPNPQAELHQILFDSSNGSFTQEIANATDFTLFSSVDVVDSGDLYEIHFIDWVVAGAISNNRDGRWVYQADIGNPIVSRPYILGKYKQVSEVEEIDVCGLNEFQHNMDDFGLRFAHENMFSSLFDININGVPATFENLQNVTNPNPGQLNFASGGNGNFNKLANTVETIKKVGEYLEWRSPSEANFDTLEIAVTSRDIAANLAVTDYRIRIINSGFRLMDRNNVQVLSGPQEAGVYRFTRTLYGFDFSFNGEVLYSTPERFVDYEAIQNEAIANAQAPVDTISGLHVVSEHEEIINLGTNTPILTGHDLTQATGMTWKIFLRDQATDRGWQIIEKDVDNILEIASLSANDGFGLAFDNDHVTVNLVDAATGEFTMTQVGRDFEYVKSYLVAKLPQARIEQDVQPTSGYVDIGDFRMQWGTSVVVGGSATIDLPMPYANNTYNVVPGTSFDGADARFPSLPIAGRTTTDFPANLLDEDGNPISGGFEWQAVGLKPTT